MAIMGAHKATRVLTQYEEDKIRDNKQYSKNYSQLDMLRVYYGLDLLLNKLSKALSSGKFS